MTKQSIKRAETDVLFIFRAYYLRSIINIIGIEASKSNLLFLIAFLGTILPPLEPFWQILNNPLPFQAKFKLS